jgi:hypothetical protein
MLKWLTRVSALPKAATGTSLPKAATGTSLSLFAQPKALAELLPEPPALPAVPTGRLIFALDATASRAATWAKARELQGEMFDATAALGELSSQLIYYSGMGCQASRWVTSAAALRDLMSSVTCVAGGTQIGRLLARAIEEAKAEKLGALIFVGDCMEENADQLCIQACELAALGTPMFLLHEGNDRIAAEAFKAMAAASGGAYLSFEAASIAQLKELLGGIAVFTVGGHEALAEYSCANPAAAPLLLQLLRL